MFCIYTRCVNTREWRWVVTKVYNIYVHAGVSECANVRNACGDVLSKAQEERHHTHIGRKIW